MKFISRYKRLIKENEDLKKECEFWKDEYECSYEERKKLTDALEKVEDILDSTCFFDQEKKMFIENK